MRKMNGKTIIKIIYVVLMLAAIMLVGCGKSEDDDAILKFNNSLNTQSPVENDATESTEVDNEETDNTAYRNQYLILEINSKNETMRVYRYANKMEYMYYYGMNTAFCNKYGNRTTVAAFTAGDVVSLSGTDELGKVLCVQKSADVWVYDEISRFSFSNEGRVLAIADTNYEIGEETYMFSGNDTIEEDAISADDKITVVGVDKKVLSVIVTTGHGILKLKNTTLFEGSFMQLNNDIFTEVTKDMEIEIPEGKYKLTVANNGWGGTKEIKIKRGKTTEVDLDKIKGDGPKKGRILFEVDVASAKVYIDNQAIDIQNPIELVYGAHSLVVMAEGYTTWSKTLYVNSEESTIIITLTNQETQSSSGANSQDSQSSQSTEKKDNTETESSEKKDSAADEMLKDYMSTISDLLDSFD